MRQLGLLSGLVILVAGCNGNGNGNVNGNGNEARDTPLVYQAVLQEELKGTKKADGWYVFVDGVDPGPELLADLQKQWPGLQPGSKAPKGKRNTVSLGDLKWIDQNTAELRGGFSNGMDGRHSRYRVIRKDGAWVVDSVIVEAMS